jgi:hypothetical protein
MLNRWCQSAGLNAIPQFRTLVRVVYDTASFAGTILLRVLVMLASALTGAERLAKPSPSIAVRRE